MNGTVFIWLTATRPVASWPEPSPEVSLNHGFCAGALAWVRTQTLCLPASVLMASINSPALLESPPGAGAFIVTVAMTFSPQIAGAGAPMAMRPGPCGEGQAFAAGIVAWPRVCKGKRTAQHEAYPAKKAYRAPSVI